MKKLIFCSFIGCTLLFILHGNDSVPVTYKKFNHPVEALALAAPYLPSNPTIIEAGAYDGTDSTFMARFWPAGTLHSFEPVPELYAKLSEKANLLPNIHTYQLALSDTISTATFYISELNSEPGIPSQSSSLLEPKEHLTYAPHVLFTKAIPVKTITLDQWAQEQSISSVDFLWLDMQGSELNALMASPKIMKTVKAILTEVEFVEAYKGQYLYQDVKNWLELQGFRMIAVDFDINKPPWFADALFVRNFTNSTQN